MSSPKVLVMSLISAYKVQSDMKLPDTPSDILWVQRKWNCHSTIRDHSTPKSREQSVHTDNVPSQNMRNDITVNRLWMCGAVWVLIKTTEQE